MPIAHNELATPILDILARASRGKGPRPHYLTAYQILLRLPDAVRQALIAEYGEPGRGAGKNFTAVSRVAQVARDVAEYDYMDARGLSFEFDEGEEGIEAGFPVIGLYRAKRFAPP